MVAPPRRCESTHKRECAHTQTHIHAQTKIRIRACTHSFQLIYTHVRRHERAYSHARAPRFCAIYWKPSLVGADRISLVQGWVAWEFLSRTRLSPRGSHIVVVTSLCGCEMLNCSLVTSLNWQINPSSDVHTKLSKVDLHLRPAWLTLATSHATWSWCAPRLTLVTCCWRREGWQVTTSKRVLKIALTCGWAHSVKGQHSLVNTTM